MCAALLSDSLDSQRFYVTRQSVCIIMRSQGVSRRANKRFLGFFSAKLKAKEVAVRALVHSFYGHFNERSSLVSQKVDSSNISR